MIQFVTGDILLTKAEALVHGIAPNDHFAQGLALSLREQWPSLYKDFRHFSHTHHPKEGTLWSWKGSTGPMVINLFTQEHSPNQEGHPGPARESYVNHCLKELAKEMKDKNLKSIALPKLATGVGGLSWEQVLPLIKTHLVPLERPIVIYETYKKGVAAQEKL